MEVMEASRTSLRPHIAEILRTDDYGPAPAAWRDAHSPPWRQPEIRLIPQALICRRDQTFDGIIINLQNIKLVIPPPTR